MFEINGIHWDIAWVNPNSDNLRRSDGSITVGMTDWIDRCVYMSDRLRGGFMRKVLAHELCHCFCFSGRHNTNIFSAVCILGVVN